MFCTKCGKRLANNSRYCYNCGRLNTYEETKPLNVEQNAIVSTQQVVVNTNYFDAEVKDLIDTYSTQLDKIGKTILNKEDFADALIADLLIYLIILSNAGGKENVLIATMIEFYFNIKMSEADISDLIFRHNLDSEMYLKSIPASTKNIVVLDNNGAVIDFNYSANTRCCDVLITVYKKIGEVLTRDGNSPKSERFMRSYLDMLQKYISSERNACQQKKQLIKEITQILKYKVYKESTALKQSAVESNQLGKSEYENCMQNEGLDQGVSNEEFDLEKSFESFDSLILYNIMLKERFSKELSMGTLSLSKGSFIIYDASEILYEAILDTFFLFRFTRLDDKVEIIKTKKKRLPCLEINLLLDYYTSYDEINLFFLSVSDMNHFIQSINYYNSCKLKHLVQMYRRAISIQDKILNDPIMLRHAENYLPRSNNQYRSTMLRLPSHYRGFIYKCLVCEEIDGKARNYDRTTAINTVLGTKITNGDISLSSKDGDSNLMDLINLCVERSGENEIVCIFIIFFLAEKYALRSKAKTCQLYSIFESLNTDASFSPHEAIEYYLQMKPYLINNSDADQSSFEGLLACLLLNKSYNCNPDIAVESFWNDVANCKKSALIADLVPKANSENRFDQLIKRLYEKEKEKAMDYTFSFVDSNIKDNILTVCIKIHSSPLFQTFDRFVQMIPENIKENIILYSIFIEEYLTANIDEPDQAVLDALITCNNQRPKYKQSIIPYDLNQKLDMFKTFLQKQFPLCIGKEAFVIISGINTVLVNKASEKMKAISGNDLQGSNIEQYVTHLSRVGMLHPDNMYSTTIFILSMYKSEQFQSFMNIPLYNEYYQVFDLINSQYNNMAQSDFEKQLMAQTPSAISKYTIDAVDLMNGIEFEDLIAKLFKAMGYSVSTTKASNDQGIDVIAERMSLEGNERIGIQAKCYSGSVGNSAIQEVVAGMAYYKLNKAIVVTNNYFTKGAIKLA